jgi:hypothetical protein
MRLWRRTRVLPSRTGPGGAYACVTLVPKYLSLNFFVYPTSNASPKITSRRSTQLILLRFLKEAPMVGLPPLSVVTRSPMTAFPAVLP